MSSSPRLETWQNDPNHYVGHGVDWEVGLLLRHHSGRYYQITAFANVSVDETEKFRHNAQYRNIDNDTVWSRPIKDMVGKFEREDGNNPCT